MLSRFSVARSTSTGRSLAVAMLLLCSSGAWAGTPPGGSVDYGPLSPASVPTLGEWTLGLLGLLMAVVAYRALRGRVNGRLLSNLMLAGGAVAATVAGHGLIREAAAVIAADEQNMSSPSGGTVTGMYWVQLTNTSGVPLRIKAIRPNMGFTTETPPELPECTVNATVSPGAKCNVSFTDSGPRE